MVVKLIYENVHLAVYKFEIWNFGLKNKLILLNKLNNKFIPCLKYRINYLYEFI